ncbi:MAG: cupin domain-containing protein [Moorea sp. SIO3G5]|nr:cupin domain-containing protein [Moorena sp. SIO3G5]
MAQKLNPSRFYPVCYPLRVSRHFFYILEGEASLVIDGTTHLLNRGDSILVPILFSYQNLPKR